MNKLSIFLLVSVVLFLGYGLYNQVNKSAKTKRVLCQLKTITFENIANKQLVAKAQMLLNSGNYTLQSHIEFSKYMPTKLGKYISIEQANKLFMKTVPLKNQVKREQKLLVKYYIYENDKADKNKKNKKAKEYEGYLVFEFILDKRLVYKIQTDFMQADASDIEERMNCIVKSFMTLKGE